MFIVTTANALELCTVFAMQVSGDATNSQTGTQGNQYVIIATTVIGFLSLLVTQLFQIWNAKQKEKRDERQREWDLEDRENARKELALRVELATARHEAAATQHRDEIMETIDKNTQMNEAALREANDVNRRIHDITRMFTEAKAEAQDAANTVADKAAAVEHEIHESAETLGRVEHNTQEAVARLRIITHD